MAYMDFVFWNLLRFGEAVLKLGTFLWLSQIVLQRKHIFCLLDTPFLIYFISSLLGGTSGKEATCQCRRQKRRGSIPGWGRSRGEGRGNPFQYSCLENTMDRGAWQATVHGGAQSWTRLKWLTTHISVHVIWQLLRKV